MGQPAHLEQAAREAPEEQVILPVIKGMTTQRRLTHLIQVMKVMHYGLFIYSSTTVDVSNSILMNTAGASNSYGIYASAGSTFTNDYNDVFNWGTPYSGDASEGAHDINLDPLFINQLTDDFRLTGYITL